MKEFHRRDFANRTGLAQAWTVKSADRLFTLGLEHIFHFLHAESWRSPVESEGLHVADCIVEYKPPSRDKPC